ncbi:MAG TPA: gamma-glutamyltransferase family protein [Candidatus Dormibacteraeota bacterium]
MVASTHWLASAAGMAILEAGGNAADAAVCAGFVLQVVEPHLNGLGGEVPILVADANDARPDVICGQGTVPALASAQAFRDLDLDHVPGSGLLAACVPGAFGAWLQLLRDRGTLPLAQVMGAAIDYAENGYPVVPAISAVIAAVAPHFEAHWPTSAATYLIDRRPPAPGSLFRNPILADTLRRLVAAGASAGDGRRDQIDAARVAFYRGFVAEAIDLFCQREELMDSTGLNHRGMLRGDDLAGWEATVEPCVALDFAGATVCKCGPWSQGPVLLQQLAMLDCLEIERLAAGSADWVHAIVEVAKLSFADRDAWYGDPTATEVPIPGLLDRDYARDRAALVGATASLELRPGNPGGRRPRMPRVMPGPGEPRRPVLDGEPTLRGVVRGDTCHVDVVDRDGTMVSATPSGGWLQSSPVIPELGFCLGTRAQMTWLEEGLPGSLRPGLRPRTTLSPTMLMRDGRPALAMGTPGGDQQDQWQLTVLLRHLHHGLNLQEAIDAPAFHTEHLLSSFAPRVASLGSVVAESRLEAESVDALRRRGHRLSLAGPWSLGRVSAVGRDAGGVLRGAANPRGMQGYAVGR